MCCEICVQNLNFKLSFEVEGRKKKKTLALERSGCVPVGAMWCNRVISCGQTATVGETGTFGKRIISTEFRL